MSNKPPIVDDQVTHEGMGFLRSLTAKTIQNLKGPVVLHVYKPFGTDRSEEQPTADNAVAVIVPYQQYLKMQEAFWPSSLFDVLERLVLLVEEGKLVEAIDKLEHLSTEADIPLAIDQAEIEQYLEEQKQQQQTASETTKDVCLHCGKASLAPLCNQCFVEGHRGGRICLKCEESTAKD